MWIPKLARHGHLTHEIVKALESDIESGKLEAGAQLPTHRELADSLEVAIRTITRAYSLAKQRGLIAGTTGRGTYVAGVEDRSSAVLDMSQNLVMRDTRDPQIRALLAVYGDPSIVAPLLDLDPAPTDASVIALLELSGSPVRDLNLPPTTL